MVRPFTWELKRMIMFEEEAEELSKQEETSKNFNPNEPYDCGYRDGLEIVSEDVMYEKLKEE